MRNLYQRVRQYRINRINMGRLHRLKGSLSGIVALITLTSMILQVFSLDSSTASVMPGITPAYTDTQEAPENQEPILDCHYEVHAHTEDCYRTQPVFDADGRQTGTEKVLICGYADYVIHVHDEHCYRDGKLVCTLPEHEEHIHDSSCYEVQEVLSCGKTEHIHTESCFAPASSGDQASQEEEVLICGYEEGEVISPAVWSEPVYSDPVYSDPVWSDPVIDEETGEVLEEPYLISDAVLLEEPRLLEEAHVVQEEVVHHHDESCYAASGVEEGSTSRPVCGQTEHVHDRSCYSEQQAVVCGELELHTHTIECYEKGPEGESPVEMGWVWYEEGENGEEILCGDPLHLICGKLALGKHQHDERCFAGGDAELSGTVKEEAKRPAQLSGNVITADGQDYRVTVTFGEDAGIPEEAQLYAEEILPQEEPESEETDPYDEYVSMTKDALGWEENPAYIRLFDIKIVDGNGEKVEIAAPVDVKIELADKESEQDTRIVHFADGAEEGDVVESLEAEGDSVRFEAEGFSVYAIVDGPPPVPLGWMKIGSVEELIAKGEEGLYIGHKDGFFFKNTLVSDGNRTGIGKTKPKAEYPPAGAAVKYYFEQAAAADQVYVYCYADDGVTRQYVYNGGNNSLSFTDEAGKTAFTVTQSSDGTFMLCNGAWYWNMQGGAGGTRFCSYNKANDENNKMHFWYFTEVVSDPYDLDGRTYSLLTWDGGKTAKAMTGTENESETGNLCAEFLTVMTHSGEAGDKLYVPNNTADILTSWTFHWVRDDIYKISVDSEGGSKYLRIDGDGLSFAEEETEAGEIRVIPGTGIHKGQICLKAGDNTLTYSGEFEKGYSVNSGVGKEWLYLAEGQPEDVLSDYYRTYSATKISVSDPRLSPETPEDEPKKVIIYTRVWNGSGYQYFALDGEGRLVPCYESGGSIEWVGSSLDELEWEFTEYGDWNEGGTAFTPNYYYELQNSYTGKYLAPLREGKPQEEGGDPRPAQILSDGTIGLNLPGRRSGQYYSPIMTWDVDNYGYTGIKVDLDAGEDAVIEPCMRMEGLDFYFAIVDELQPDDMLHDVPTVDNDQYGIKMKMVNIGTRAEMSNYLGSDVGGKVKTTVPGLLSTDLGADGYPTAHAGSLAGLYSGAEEVNHLFIESIFLATGYYEFDSSQNYATLQGRTSGDFTVYQELGSYDSAGERDTLKHGQFFPYNDLQPGVFANTNGRNLYTPEGEELDESDPRYNEQLYLVGNGTPDCFFGMELEASFVQTPSGLDAWGHDIIFEFSGDDDFWLYVDDELVIDLGGIHSALPGDVNFRTGDVHVNGANTTLYNLFYENYEGRGHTAAEAQAYVDGLFETKYDAELGRNVTVFKDNTPHTMRIFYMERGAGASNLHMRFNLASVKRGTVQLSKKLLADGEETSDSAVAVYPYQVFYKDPRTGVWVQMTRESGSVKYKDSTLDVDFRPTLSVDHIQGDSIYRAEYENVFMLKPGETAEITFPIFGETGSELFVEEYRIVECGVDPNVYRGVSADGAVITGTPVFTDKKVEGEHVTILPEAVDSGLRDYAVEYTSLEQHSRVTYENDVEETKPLTIWKELYRKHGAERELIELYDEDGEPLDPDNPDLARAFEFRLYFKTPFDPDFVPANVHTYYVKDPGGYYCKWDKQKGAFVRITNEAHPDGIKAFEDLSEDRIEEGHIIYGERTAAAFETSMNGSISQIPAYYQIEVREIIPGTQYKVIERPAETPDGYQFWQYAINGEAAAQEQDPMEGVEGTVVSGEGNDSTVQVRNDKGYVLRLKKIWADAATMKDRDPVWFAVYYEETEGSRQLVDGTVRQLAYTDDAEAQELIWSYLNLPIDGSVFNRYMVYEVEVTGDSITVDSDGVVTGYDTVTPVGNGGVVTLNGTPVGAESGYAIQYKVTYADPVEDGDNVRKFEVSNTPTDRPGVKITKTDWAGNPLKDAVFTLAHGDSQIWVPSRASDESGWVATEHLMMGEEYVLTETQSPVGYYGLQEPLTIKLVSDPEAGWTLDVTAEEAETADYYVVGNETEIDPETGEETEYVTLTIKNRPYDFRAVKVDGTDSAVTVQGAQFELYEQRKVGSSIGWVLLYDELSTDENGLIPKVDSSLPPGTYQLHEKKAAGGYAPIDGNINFTVSEKGVIELGDHPENVTFRGPTEEAGGMLAYQITIPNEPLPLRLRKTDPSGKELPGATFELRKYEASWVVVPGYAVIDLTEDPTAVLSGLSAGRYRLSESSAPDGYVIQDPYIYFNIAPDRTVTLTDEAGTGPNSNRNAGIMKGGDTIFTITVQNNPGAALPAAGGPGKRFFYLLGSALLVLAAAGLRRKRDSGRPV